MHKISYSYMCRVTDEVVFLFLKPFEKPGQIHIIEVNVNKDKICILCKSSHYSHYTYNFSIKHKLNKRIKKYFKKCILHNFYNTYL